MRSRMRPLLFMGKSIYCCKPKLSGVEEKSFVRVLVLVLVLVHVNINITQYYDIRGHGADGY